MTASDWSWVWSEASASQASYADEAERDRDAVKQAASAQIDALQQTIVARDRDLEHARADLVVLKADRDDRLRANASLERTNARLRDPHDDDRVEIAALRSQLETAQRERDEARRERDGSGRTYATHSFLICLQA